MYEKIEKYQVYTTYKNGVAGYITSNSIEEIVKLAKESLENDFVSTTRIGLSLDYVNSLDYKVRVEQKKKELKELYKETSNYNFDCKLGYSWIECN